jgi:hypothetical protein
VHEAPADLEGHHPHRVVLRNRPLEHVVEDRAHLLVELPGTAWNHHVALGFTHARVADVNAVRQRTLCVINLQSQSGIWMTAAAVLKSVVDSTEKFYFSLLP